MLSRLQLKKRLQNSYRINRQLRKIVLIQLIVILVLIIICSICIVFLNKGNVQDTSKKSMESSSISKDSAYNGKHTQGSAIADDDTSDHADDSTQSDSMASNSENDKAKDKAIKDALPRMKQALQEVGTSTHFTYINSEAVDEHYSNITGGSSSGF